MLENNFGLIVKRGFYNNSSPVTFITKHISDRRFWSSPGMQGAESIFPLYLYPDSTGQQNAFEEGQGRVPNLNMEMVQRIADGLKLTFIPEAEEGNVCMANSSEVRAEYKAVFSPIDILDYIYAVLHSPKYRETYKEFLKIDFPRVPYPTDARTFWNLVALGGELRQLHLLESPTTEKYITQYPIDGDNVVGKIRFEENYELINGNTITNADPVYTFGRVYINEKQFFQQVPETAWNFYIGGYQPAQKWLKDRKDRTLTYEDIFHYQKMIVALFETDRIMKEIDEVAF